MDAALIAHNGGRAPHCQDLCPASQPTSPPNRTAPFRLSGKRSTQKVSNAFLQAA